VIPPTTKAIGFLSNLFLKLLNMYYILSNKLNWVRLQL